MIAGETESILSTNRRLDRHYPYEEYDNFLFFGKKKNGRSNRSNRSNKSKKVKKQLSAEEQAARRARRQKFWSSIGSSLEEGGAVSNVLGMLGNSNPSNPPNVPKPEDYQINFGEEKSSTVLENKKEDSNQKKGIPAPAIVIVGVLVLGVIYLGYQNYQSSQEAKRLES